MQREVGTEPDYVTFIRNNLQDPNTSNPSASAGKYFVFGEGPIKNKLVKKGIKFDDKEMFLMAHNHNFEEEKVSKVRKKQRKGQMWKIMCHAKWQHLVPHFLTTPQTRTKIPLNLQLLPLLLMTPLLPMTLLIDMDIACNIFLFKNRS